MEEDTSQAVTQAMQLAARDTAIEAHFILESLACHAHQCWRPPHRETNVLSADYRGACVFSSSGRFGIRAGLPPRTCLLELWGAFAHRQRVDRKYLGFTMDGQLKPLGKKLLNHQPDLSFGRFGRRLCSDVETRGVGRQPGWTRDLVIL